MPTRLSLPPRRLALSAGGVLLTGALGTALRVGLLNLASSPIPRGVAVFHTQSWTSDIPWMLLGINFTGVLVAVVLLRGALRHHDPNDLLRLLLITGFLGGYTSYSSLFVSLAQIWHQSVTAGVLVGAGAVASGVLAGWLGLRLRPRHP